MVFSGGHAWFFLGGVHGFCQVGGPALLFPGGACMVFPGGGACIGFDEIRSMSGRYASYWNVLPNLHNL